MNHHHLYIRRYVRRFPNTIPSAVPFEISGIILGVIPGPMLDVFLTETHGTIPISNRGLIYGAMIFKTFFGRLF